MDNPFNNTRNYIDSRDVIAYADYLAEQIALHEDPQEGDEDPEIELVEAADELGAVVDFIQTASDSPDWEYGETIIPEDDFVDYAKELAEDLSGMREHGWPFCHIDWDAAAESLKMDHIEATYRGRGYLIRA